MEITISKAELNHLLQITQSIVEKKTTMPILANALLTASDSKFSVAATDLEITALATSEAEVQNPGSTTVSAKVLSDIVRELPEGDVHLKVGEAERLEISAPNSSLRMLGVSAEEFPSLPGISVNAKHRVDTAQLVGMISRTLYAASSDETRFNLNGVCFETVKDAGVKGALRLAATDGHRLAVVTRQIDGLLIPERVIVPKKGLGEIRRVLDGSEDPQVGIAIEDGFLVVESSRVKMSMRLIDGEFPDYGQVIPKDEGVAASVSCSALAESLRRVALMVTDKGKCVKFDFTRNNLRISSSSPELGDAEEHIDITYAGEPTSIGFNARYVLDVIASLEGCPTLTIELHGKLGPGRFFSDSDESYLAVVMPMRLSD
jgi:DNA polymerase-3 subunit beta